MSNTNSSLDIYQDFKDRFPSLADSVSKYEPIYDKNDPNVVTKIKVFFEDCVMAYDSKTHSLGIFK